MSEESKQLLETIYEVDDKVQEVTQEIEDEKKRPGKFNKMVFMTGRELYGKIQNLIADKDYYRSILTSFGSSVDASYMAKRSLLEIEKEIERLMNLKFYVEED